MTKIIGRKRELQQYASSSCCSSRFLPIIFVIYYIVNGLNNLLVLAANIQKIPLKAKRIGKKVALSGNFNIFRATLSAQIGHGMTEKGI